MSARRPDRRRHARLDELPRPTLALPCDRCTAVQPLYRHGHELLCLACTPGVEVRR